MSILQYKLYNILHNIVKCVYILNFGVAHFSLLCESVFGGGGLLSPLSTTDYFHRKQFCIGGAD